MQILKRFFNWYSSALRQQTLVGKVVLGSVSIFVLCCLCSAPLSILSLTTPTPEVKNSAVAQIQDASPTVAPSATEAASPSPVATVTTFLSILPANNGSPTPEPFLPPTIVVPVTGGQVVIIFVNKSAEFVDIKNNSASAQDLNGWRLVSETGNQSCTLAGTIEPGAVLRIFAQASGDPGYNCGFRGNIWNNSKSDPAVLYDAQGKEVSRY